MQAVDLLRSIQDVYFQQQIEYLFFYYQILFTIINSYIFMYNIDTSCLSSLQNKIPTKTHAYKNEI